ncbi:MAG: sensor histidine kinase [Bellilinea sp.]
MEKKTNPVLPLPGIRWRGFTLQLFVLTILPLTVLVMAVVLISQSLHHRAMVDLVGDRNLRAVRTAGDGLTQHLVNKVDQLRMAASLIEDGLDPAGQNTALDLLGAEFDGGMALFDSHAVLTWALDGEDFWTALPTSQPEFWRQVVAGQPDQAVLAAVEYSTNETLELAGLRLSDGRILVGGFSPAPLIQQSTASILTNDQAHILVVTTANTVLYFSGDASTLGDVGRQPGVSESLNGESGVNIVAGEHGDRVTAFSSIPGAGWGIVLTENWEEIATPFLNTTQSAPLLMIPLLILALVALLFGARQIIQPLQDLEARTVQLARGNFKAIEQPVGGIDEIKHLQNVLVETAGDLQSAREALRGYIGAITDGVEKERRGLARELHDDTLQALIALNQRLQLARQSADTDEERASLDELQRMTGRAISNLRRMVRGLRPIYLEDLGLTTALDMLAKEATNNDGQPVHFSVHGEPQRLTPGIELALYRMAQEALNNASRHAKAQSVNLELSFEPHQVRMSIWDNGVGFEMPQVPDEFARKGHFGLLGLTERAELINAELKVESLPGEGTRVEVAVPLR